MTSGFFLNLEVNYETRAPKKEDSLFKKFWDRPTKVQRVSDGESGIKISSQRSKISISSHQTKTDDATLQQSKEGIVLFEVSTNMNITLCCPRQHGNVNSVSAQKPV